MTLMRFDPFRELDRLGERVLSGGGFRTMPTEAFRRDDTFYVLIDLPGVATDDLDVTVERNVVKLSAKRTSPRRDGDELIVDERPHGEFSRQFFLGDNLDAQKLEARYDQGVLTITIPVAAESKPRQIPVGSADRNAQAQQVDVAGSDRQTANA